MSSHPRAALELQCDLQNWDSAIKLAQRFDQEKLPELHYKAAIQWECKGENHQVMLTSSIQALKNFEKGLIPSLPVVKGKTQKRPHFYLQCLGGLSRCSLRLGELHRGMEAASELNEEALLRECAAILEKMGQYTEAASLYNKSGNTEKAVALYIQDLNFNAATPLMSQITSTKLHLQFAKAKESRGNYQEALEAYRRANDFDAVARLYLNHLNEPKKAFSLIREMKSIKGAELATAYCKKKGSIREAIEFLQLAGHEEEAFHLAESREEMEAYAEALQGTGLKEQHLKIAHHFEERNLMSKAAEHYKIAGEYKHALTLYLKVGDTEIENAIDVVGKARNDALTHKLIDFLTGETDNIPKDPKYLYKIHIVLGKSIEAADTAVIIARQEQDMGNYKAAHSLLFTTYRDLEKKQLRIPAELWRHLLILHSYVLVKRLIKMGDHHSAALMLQRVAQNISRFPAHVVPILTSVVIECQRAGLKTSAHHYACMLMKPEYRQKISESYKRKIENMVRKASEDQPPPDMSPCPYCINPLADEQLECSVCLNISPFCIATGKHLIPNDCCQCPNCSFPAQYSAFVESIKQEKSCSMCGENLLPENVQRVELQDLLSRHKAQLQTDTSQSAVAN